MSDTLKNIESFFKENGYRVIKQEDHLLKKEASFYNNFFKRDEVDLNPFAKPSLKSKKEKIKSNPASVKGSPIDYDVATIIKSLNWNMDKIKDRVVNREDIINQAIFSILTGEHMLILSRTGMAKSYLANYIFSIFSGARVFASQASKDQTPDNYFGPYNIEEFKRGQIKHNIKGSIIEANFVFLDEFFDASDVVLRSLLSVLNERKFVNGSEQIDVSIHTAIATANYMRMNEVTEAVLDRFTYKSIIPENYNLYNQLMIDHTYEQTAGIPQDNKGGVYFEQILFLTDIIKNKNKEIKIVTPDLIYFIKNILINKFVGEMRKNDSNFFISPRKQAKISDYLRASALSHNRFEVTLEDLQEMYLCLCTLNSFISVKSKDKSEKDIFNDLYQQTMIHLNASGAIPQIEFLLKIRNIFDELRANPEKKESILAKKGLGYFFKDLILKIFPHKQKSTKEDQEELTIDSLKKHLSELQPVVEEVRNLKDGLIQEYHQDFY